MMRQGGCLDGRLFGVMGGTCLAAFLEFWQILPVRERYVQLPQPLSSHKTLILIPARAGGEAALHLEDS
jgi:hypothetical protein